MHAFSDASNNHHYYEGSRYKSRTYMPQYNSFLKL